MESRYVATKEKEEKQRQNKTKEKNNWSLANQFATSEHNINVVFFSKGIRYSSDSSYRLDLYKYPTISTNPSHSR